MAKVKIKADNLDEGIGPLPNSQDELMDGQPEGPGSSSQSTISVEPDPVTVDLCGKAVALPFDFWHELNNAAQPLSDKEIDNIAMPLARVLTKHGWAEWLSRDELQLLFFAAIATYSRFKAVADAKRAAEELKESLDADSTARKGAGAGY